MQEKLTFCVCTPGSVFLFSRCAYIYVNCCNLFFSFSFLFLTLFFFSLIPLHTLFLSLLSPCTNTQGTRRWRWCRRSIRLANGPRATPTRTPRPFKRTTNDPKPNETSGRDQVWCGIERREIGDESKEESANLLLLGTKPENQLSRKGAETDTFWES